MNNVITLPQQPRTSASTARAIPFEIVENPPKLNPNIRPKGLLLHCGAQIVDRADLFEVITPNGSKTHFPIPHRDLLTEVENQLRETGFIIQGETHALSHEGQRYFGVIQVSLPTRNEQDFNWVVGLRNSHDKSLTSGVVAGTQVLVCDNLCFNGEVKLSRKHTRHIMRDLRQLTARAVGQLGDKFRDLDRRVASYKQHYLPDRSAHDLVIRAVDCGAVTPSQVPAVLQEWRKPQHQEFLPRNVWSLFNAVTEIHKTVNPHTAMKRGEALYGLCDAAAGLN